VSRIFTPRNILVIVVIMAVIVLSRVLFPAPLPTVVLPAEVIGYIGGFPITNTMIATLLADVTVLILGYMAVRKKDLVPGGLQNALEAAYEFFLNLAQDVAGPKIGRAMMPLAMTAFAFILAANWWGRVPGFEAIGFIETPHQAGLQTWRVQTLIPNVLYTITAQEGPISTADEHPAEEGHVPEFGILLPWLRGATTDLNVTIALALIAFFYVQYHGFRANGLGYLKKFFNFSGGIAFFVGILEFISEFAKIISFSFRLFGNIFAGTVLVFVMSFLLPWIVPVPFAGLELFVGFIQAVVFAMLVIIFAAGARESHEEHSDDAVATHADEAADELEEVLHAHA